MSSTGDLKKQLGDILEEAVSAMFEAKPMPREGHEALFSHVADLAARSGTATPKILLSSMEAPNAAAIAGHRLLVSEGLFDALETSAKAAPTPELSAVIGHEMGHLKNIKKETSISLALLYGAPIAAMVTYYCIRKLRHHGKNGNESLELINEAMDERVTQGQKDTEQAPDEKRGEKTLMQKTRSAVATGVKYMAVAALGGAIGMIGLRQFKLSREYAADAHGASMTSPETMASALVKLQNRISAIARNQMAQAPEQDAELVSRIASAANKFAKHVAMAHPSIQQRTDRLLAR